MMNGGMMTGCSLMGWAFWLGLGFTVLFFFLFFLLFLRLVSEMDSRR